MADKLGYSSKQFVSNWERGASLPPKDKLADIAKIFSLKRENLVKIYVQEKTKSLLQGLE